MDAGQDPVLDGDVGKPLPSVPGLVRDPGVDGVPCPPVFPRSLSLQSELFVFYYTEFVVLGTRTSSRRNILCSDSIKVIVGKIHRDL